MILGDLADLIGGKVNMTDSATLALIKSWAARRHDMLCQHALWLDLLNLYTLSVSAAQSEVILRPQIAHVVGARYDMTNLMPVDQVFSFIADPSVWDRTGRATRMARLPSLGTYVKPTSEKINLVSASAGDTAKSVSIVGELGGEEMRETLTLNGTSTVVSANSYDVIYSIAKEQTAGMVTITGFTTAAVLGYIAAQETGRRYPRIRLLETPSQALTLVVLGKRRVPKLVANSDETAFDGLDLALEAFTLADTYEWLKQTEDAADKRNEGFAMLQQLKNTIAYQEAGQQQLVPGDVHGLDEGALDGKGYW